MTSDIFDWLTIFMKLNWDNYCRFYIDWNIYVSWASSSNSKSSLITSLRTSITTVSDLSSWVPMTAIIRITHIFYQYRFKKGYK